jgi:hypothetical protein
VEHEIYLLCDSPLPNIGLYRQPVLEVDEVKKQLHPLLECIVIILITSPYRSSIIVVPKKDGTW